MGISTRQGALLLFCALGALTAFYVAKTSPAVTLPVVTLTQGRVEGTFLSQDLPHPIEAFRGIPYAQPPTSQRRFRHLKPLPASNKTIRAYDYGSICPGKTFRDPAKQPMSEDCITANVFRPVNTTRDSKLPVALHLHGGAFNRGQGEADAPMRD